MTIDLIIEIFEINGLLYVALAALTAGIVRGFSGFGTAMIFLPVAGKYFEPVTAIIILTIMDLCGPALIVPRALRDAYKPDLFRLIGGMILTLPIALYFLLNMETELFRYIVSILALVLVFVLATGWRFEGQLHSGALIGLGGIAGVSGGIAGVPGPPAQAAAGGGGRQAGAGPPAAAPGQHGRSARRAAPGRRPHRVGP